MYCVPYGTRLVTDRAGELRAIVGMVARTVSGTLLWGDQQHALAVDPNQVLTFKGGQFHQSRPSTLASLRYGV